MKKKFKTGILTLIIGLSLICLLLFGCEKTIVIPEDEPEQITIKTITNQYDSVIIGTQTWMAENLKETNYNDNTPIPNITDKSQWSTDMLGAYCWYNNDTANIKHGALYNWYTVETGKLCPIGWHVPSDEDWFILEQYLGMNQSELNHMGHRGVNIGDTIKLLLNASMCSIRLYDGSFYEPPHKELEVEAWWTSTIDNDTNYAIYRAMHNDSYIQRYRHRRQMGFSVRCIKN